MLAKIKRGKDNKVILNIRGKVHIVVNPPESFSEDDLFSYRVIKEKENYALVEIKKHECTSFVPAPHSCACKECGEKKPHRISPEKEHRPLPNEDQMSRYKHLVITRCLDCGQVFENTDHHIFSIDIEKGLAKCNLCGFTRAASDIEILIEKIRREFNTLDKFKTFVSSQKDFNLVSELTRKISKIENQIKYLNSCLDTSTGEIMKRIREELRNTQNVSFSWRPKFFTEIEKIFKDNLPQTFILHVSFIEDSDIIEDIIISDETTNLNAITERTLRKKGHKILYNSSRTDDFAWTIKGPSNLSVIRIIYNWSSYFSKEEIIKILIEHQEDNPKFSKIILKNIIEERRNLVNKLNELKTIHEAKTERIYNIIKILKKKREKFLNELEKTETYKILRIVAENCLKIFPSEDVEKIYKLANIHELWSLSPEDLLKIVISN